MNCRSVSEASADSLSNFVQLIESDADSGGNVTSNLERFDLCLHLICVVRVKRKRKGRVFI